MITRFGLCDVACTETEEPASGATPRTIKPRLSPTEEMMLLQIAMVMALVPHNVDIIDEVWCKDQLKDALDENNLISKAGLPQLDTDVGKRYLKAFFRWSSSRTEHTVM